MLVAFTGHAVAQSTVATSKTTSLPHFRIAVNGGFSRLLAKTSESVEPKNRDYVSALKSGYNYGIDATYFISKEWGLGVKFNQFRSSHVGTLYDEYYIPMTIETVMVHTFIGPSLASKYVSPSGKHTLLSSVALGYMGYLSDVRSFMTQITGGTVGAVIDIGYDYSITKRFAIGPQLSFAGGVLNKLTYKGYSSYNKNVSYTQELDKNNRESMSRLDISFGARFNF